MALTPDDVVNKRFQPTKFREGYDQDEVDDFLDEVVEELRRLNNENDELRAQLSQGGAAVAPSSAEESQVPAPVAVADQAPAAEEPAQPEEPAVAQEPEPEPTPEPVQPVAPVAPAAVAGQADGDPTAANGLLAMAQKVHDDYVAAGATERDRLISDARTRSESLVSEAQTKADSLVSQAETTAAEKTRAAEETREATLKDLESKKTGLQDQIEKLRGFERDYRSRLSTYIQGQLNELDSKALIADEPGPLDK